MILFLTSIKGRSLQHCALISGMITMVSCGFHLEWPGIYLQQLLDNTSPIQISDDEGSWIAVFYLIGAIIGSVLSAYSLDKFGRQKLMMFTTFPFLICNIITAFASSFFELCAARFVAGLSYATTFCTLPFYFAEIADANVRGLFLSVIPLMQLCGVLLITSIGSYQCFKVVAFIGLIFPILTFTFLWLPDTPHYYIINGKLENARKSLQRYSGKLEVDEQFKHILKTVPVCQNANRLLSSYLLNKNSRKAFFIVLIVYTVQQWSGIFAFMFYLPTILKNSENIISPLTSTSIYYILQIITSIISMTIIDKVGRKPLLILSIFIVAVAQFIVGTFFGIQYSHMVDLRDYSGIPLFGLFLFIIGYSLGLFNIPILLIAEIFPIEIKVFAGSLGEIYFCVASILVSKYFQYAKDEFGLHVPFLTYGLCCVCSLPFIICLMSETKGKTLEEIQINC